MQTYLYMPFSASSSLVLYYFKNFALNVFYSVPCRKNIAAATNICFLPYPLTFRDVIDYITHDK